MSPKKLLFLMLKTLDVSCWSTLDMRNFTGEQPIVA